VVGHPAGAAARHLEAFRSLLASTALADEDAFKLVCEPGDSKTAVNAAHRARISKLATDLGKVNVGELNVDRVDTVIQDFCKALGQSQRDADYALVLRLGCVKNVIDICSTIRCTCEATPQAWKPMSAVMLSALKWLGLLGKQKCARIYLLLTNRAVPLADVATACLNAQGVGVVTGSSGTAVTAATETQNISFLYLPQVLHVLSLLLKQALPECAQSDGVQRHLVSYLLVCGLPEKLRDLFRRAEVRGMRLFDGSSPVPLVLLRAMDFLGTLLAAYRLPPGVSSSTIDTISAGNAGGGGAGGGACTEEEALQSAGITVLQTLRNTELFGVVSVLVSILLSKGPLEKQGAAGQGPPKLPQTVVSLSVRAVRILNHVARLDLTILQENLGACRQQEIYHLMVGLLDYCSSRLQETGSGVSQGQDESDLLHETITLLGYVCLECSQNQSIMCYGEGQSLLAKLAALPLHYFMDEKGRQALFPTILATCFRSSQNVELLRNEMNLSLLRNFLSEAQGDEAFAHRFPPALWEEALAFFTDEAPGGPSCDDVLIASCSLSGSAVVENT
jgi:hypothetical protein